jgi:hypothetical protein
MSSTPHSLSCAQILVTLKPDDTQSAGYDANNKINNWHGTEVEEILENRDGEDKDKAGYRS